VTNCPDCGAEMADGETPCRPPKDEWDAWERAWDAARSADQVAGRRYDKARYAEAAHQARIRFLETKGVTK